MVITIVITMNSPPGRRPVGGPVEFHGVAFARNISRARHFQQLSTRDLARLAGISQSYVVALERPQSAGDPPGPTPTVDVLARLAHALGLHPGELFEQSMRPAGRHVLLVVDDANQPMLDSVRSLTGDRTATWVAADAAREPHALPLRLRRNKRTRYERTVIEASLHGELARLAPLITGHDVGFVFAEMSAVMTALHNPEELIDFEHRWAEVVATAAANVGAHAAWNVCVYEIDALRALPDPIAATLELVRSHDTVWSIDHNRVSVGAKGVRRIAERLRPEGSSARSWQSVTNRLVDQSRLAS